MTLIPQQNSHCLAFLLFYCCALAAVNLPSSGDMPASQC